MDHPLTYYNEWGAFPAAWLTTLMGHGLITPGAVDSRSIVDVRPADVMGSVRCHWFAGIGGWDIALQLAELPAECPIWTASLPCQPFSVAGKRLAHRDERHLWPVFHNLVAECRPPAIVGEQVASELGRRWFSRVRSDLEALGYAVGCADLCAASAGTPHQRQRLFWGAHLNLYQHPRSHRPRRSCPPDAPWQAPKAFQVQRRRVDELVAMGLTQGLSTYADARRLLDGLPHRMEQLRGFGNAIVPQVGAVFLRSFLEAREQLLARSHR